jgi:hypothetical protein
MAQPGAEKDQAGREFEALLAALPRKPAAMRAGTGGVSPRAPLGDAEFEDLLGEFRGLGNSTPAGEMARSAARLAGFCFSPPSADIVEMLDAMARERGRLASRRDAIQDETALAAIESLDRLTTNLQIALMRDRPDKILLLRSNGQHFALPLAGVSRTLGQDELEFDEKKGIRAGEDWLPVRSLGACRHGNDAPVPAHGYVVIAAGPGGALALGVESVVGVVTATLAPLDAILQGARGLKGVAITDAGVHALMLDVNRLARGA